MIAPGRHGIGVWLLPMLFLATLVYLAVRLRIEADFSAFLPRGLTDTQRVFLQQLREGVASRLVLIELRGEEPARLAAISRAFAGRLAHDGAFRYVLNGSDSWARELALIERYRYVLSDAVTAEKFTSAGLRIALEERLEGLAGSASLIEKRLLASDPTGETLHVLQQRTLAKSPQRIDGVWFNRAGDGALLIAETVAPGSDLRGQQDAVAALRKAFDEARAGAEATLRLSSPGVMAAESRALIEQDAARLSLVSSTLILALLAWFYRSLPVMLFCAVPAALGLLVGIAAVNLWFGSVHAITLGFGVTLLGEAVDYPSYMLTQVDEKKTAGPALKHVAPTLRLAVLTTACGSLALLMASFAGLAELGLLTIVGVLAAGVATSLLPRWLPSGWRGVPVRPLFAHLASVPALHAPTTSRRGIAFALVAAALVLAAPRAWWDDDLASMNPLPLAFKEQDRRLREELGAADVRSLIAISAGNPQRALEAAERLRPHLVQWTKEGIIGGFDLASDYLPSDAAQALRQSALPPREVLQANLAEAARDLPFKPGTFAPFIDAVDQARQSPPLSAEQLAGTAFAAKLDALLARDGDRTLLVVPLSGVADAAAVVARTRALMLPGVEPLDLRAQSVEMMASYRRQALAYAALGAVLIFVVLTHGLRGPRRAWRTMSPVVIALVTTAATLVALRQPLSVFHLVALLLVLGIGINYALFLGRAVDRRDDLARTLQTVAFVSGTTLCAFGTLAFSTTPVLRAIGLTVTIGVVASLLCCFLLLEAEPKTQASLGEAS